MRNKIYVFSGCMLLSMSATLYTHAQTSTELFGQNRVQSKTFNWKYYEAKRFKIYHYDKAGTDLSRYVAEQMEQDLTAIENQMGGIFPNQLDIMLYNCFDDFQQTNIGLTSNNNIHNNTAGRVNIVGNKLVVYFTGNHSDLKRQLRSALSSIILEKTVFGDNIVESLKNALVLNLPKWFTEGYLEYVVDGWDSRTDNEWKALINTGKPLKFEELARKYPQLSGKAFWKYLIERYGEKEVKDFIFLTQNDTKINKAIRSLTDKKIVPNFDSLIVFYQNAYNTDLQNQTDITAETPLLNIENKDYQRRIYNVKVSPRGYDVAYVAWKNGMFDVILETSKQIEGIRKKHIAKIVSGGLINHNESDDPNYPILAWSNTGYKLGIIYKKYGTIYLKVYDAVKAKIEMYIISNKKFDRVLSFTFMEDDDMIVMSAIKGGQSDLYEYRLKRGRINQITNDAYDDLEPNYVSGGSRKGIAFLSNRPEPYINIQPLPNELPTGRSKGYFYNSTTQNYELLPLTPNEKGDVTQIIPYGPDNFAYLTNNNGVYNRNVVAFSRDNKNKDVAYSIPVTDGNYGILYQQYNPASKSIADAIKTPDGIKVYFRKVNLPEPFGDLKAVNRIPASLVEEAFLSNTKKNVIINDQNIKERSKASSSSTDKNNNNAKDQLDIKEGDAMQSKFSRNRKRKAADNTNTEDGAGEKVVVRAESDGFAQKLSGGSTAVTDSTQKKHIVYVDSTYIRLRSKEYKPSYKTDFYSLRLDNNILFTRYQNFTGTISTPSLGGMLSASVYDKMENYRFTGGLRIPFATNGSAYFVQFDNFKRKVDWGLTYFRETQNQDVQLIANTPAGRELFILPIKPVVNILQGYANYPLDKTKSIRLNVGLRQDRTILRAVNPVSAIVKDEDKYYITSRLEYVHDDTRAIAPNILDGLRLKLFGEYLYKLHDDNVYANGGQTRPKTGGFYNFGFDIRYYEPIYKNMIFAIRTAGAHSGGNEKILYMLGGVDNSLNAKLDDYPIPSSKFAFQSLATNLRGYNQNARNGNTYFLVNAELRMPVFETLFRKPVQSSILKNLQAIAFVDAGSAWQYLIPSKEDQRSRSATFISPTNSINSPGNVTLTVNNAGVNSVGLGYGLGLRTMLYGYFIRADAAMNLNNKIMYHISLGFDF
ncbi:hypothetical protein DBR32_04710 [Taibaiella sp. KBW10]|uniref:hypothetical protein n=1 Tax=Taibaiella sp. KBW10 TaxID=2153357 RepID=UPI000F596E70|nr:hypothetical protein [Taibaiella sp. KBW10]RQO31273.1 hypothetical protein DBR32_04710 [Taibaiella sp. KBW10]